MWAEISLVAYGAVKICEWKILWQWGRVEVRAIERKSRNTMEEWRQEAERKYVLTGVMFLYTVKHFFHTAQIISCFFSKSEAPRISISASWWKTLAFKFQRQKLQLKWNCIFCRLSCAFLWKKHEGKFVVTLSRTAAWYRTLRPQTLNNNHLTFLQKSTSYLTCEHILSCTLPSHQTNIHWVKLMSVCRLDS